MPGNKVEIQSSAGFGISVDITAVESQGFRAERRSLHDLEAAESTHILSGQLSGLSRDPPSITNFRTCSLDKPWYGCSANVLISHRTTPNDLRTHEGPLKYRGVGRTAPTPWSCFSPAVRVGGEDAVLQRLRSHPPDRKQTLPSFAVVVGLINVSGHTEVCNSDRLGEDQFTHTHRKKNKQAWPPPIFTVKSSATMQFLAARSLWTNFLALRYAMPSAISAAIWIISFSVGGGRPVGLFCKNTHTHRWKQVRVHSLMPVCVCVCVATYLRVWSEAT